ncbi:MAG: hypothetical protein QM760_14995 [Nibricoccus sp.]
MADESVTKEEVNAYHVERFHAVNVKMMKAGGYLRAIKQLRQAKALGLKTSARLHGGNQPGDLQRPQHIRWC